MRRSLDQEQALYLTAVGLGLFMGAIGLFVAVFWRQLPMTAPDRVGRAAAGGSSTQPDSEHASRWRDWAGGA